MSKRKVLCPKIGKEILNTLALQVMDIKFLPLIWICLHVSLHCIFPHLWVHEETTILEIRRLLKKNKYSSEKSVASSAEREFWELDWNRVPTGISLSCSFTTSPLPPGCYSRRCDSIRQKCDCAFCVSVHGNTPLTTPQCPTWAGAPLRKEWVVSRC